MHKKCFCDIIVFSFSTILNNVTLVWMHLKAPVSVFLSDFKNNVLLQSLLLQSLLWQSRLPVSFESILWANILFSAILNNVTVVWIYFRVFVSLFLFFIFLLLLCNVCLLMKYARARSTFRKQAGHLALLLLCRRETGGVSPSPLSRSVPRPHPQDAWVGGSDAHYSGYALAPKWPPPTSLAERHGAVRAGAASPFSKMLLRIRQC